MHVVASGPIHGIGTETQTEKAGQHGQINDVTLRFDDGTVTFVEPETYGVKVNLRTCTGS